MLGLALALSIVCSTFLESSGAIAARLQGYMWLCQDQKETCWWHKAVVSPPKGWIEDTAWTQRYRAAVFFQNGDKARNKPLMYVRAHNGDKEQDLEGYIRVAQERWAKRLPDSTIEPLADVERGAKPTFKIFLYRNPSQPEQAFELTAFMKDVDDAHQGQTYFFQVVLAAPSLTVLENAKPAFFELLGNL
jgi:hypothetical protein